VSRNPLPSISKRDRWFYKRGMSTKKLLPWPVAEKFFVSISSLLSADRSSIAREVLLWILFRFLGSFSIGDNVRRLLKLGKRLDLGNHGSIRGSWPMAISGSPRGHSVKTVTWCRSTQGRTSYLILPSRHFQSRPFFGPNSSSWSAGPNSAVACALVSPTFREFTPS
jgi:hypothetical protein